MLAKIRITSAGVVGSARWRLDHEPAQANREDHRALTAPSGTAGDVVPPGELIQAAQELRPVPGCIIRIVLWVAGGMPGIRVRVSARWLNPGGQRSRSGADPGLRKLRILTRPHGGVRPAVREEDHDPDGFLPAMGTELGGCARKGPRGVCRSAAPGIVTRVQPAWPTRLRLERIRRHIHRLQGVLLRRPACSTLQTDELRGISGESND